MGETRASAKLPLLGKRVLITRASGQARGLAERLRELGAETILIPTIEIVAPASFAGLDEALGDLANFDLVAFTSGNGVRAFADRAAELGVRVSAQRIAVVGPATARAVEAIGLRVDRMPPVYTAEALAAMLLPEVRGKRVLLVLAEAAGARLETALRDAGAQVEVAAAYANRIPEGSPAAMRELFADKAGVPDAVTFTSASTAEHLVALLERAGLKLPETIARISIGPMTSAALARLGIAAHAEAAESTIDALVEAVVERLRI